MYFPGGNIEFCGSFLTLLDFIMIFVDWKVFVLLMDNLTLVDGFTPA